MRETTTNAARQAFFRSKAGLIGKTTVQSRTHRGPCKPAAAPLSILLVRSSEIG